MADHRRRKRLVDLSHVIEHGMITYKGLPGPHICDYWTRERSAAHLRRRLDLPDRPDRHGRQYRHLSRRALPPLRRRRRPGRARRSTQLAALPGLVVRAAATAWRSTPTRSTGSTSPARRCWSTPAGTGTGAPTPISTDHPFLTEAAARLLVERGARLVGIDSHNIDDTRAPLAPGPHHPARRRRPDLRAYDQSRRAARRRLPLHRGAAEDRRHGHLPGPGVRAESD